MGARPMSPWTHAIVGIGDNLGASLMTLMTLMAMMTLMALCEREIKDIWVKPLTHGGRRQAPERGLPARHARHTPAPG